MTFLSFLISGISLGSIYAIIALGYTMVYGIAKMLNFAHGDVIMVGAYICFFATSRYEMPPIVGILLAVVVCTILGIVIEKLAYKPLRAAPILAVLITAIGVSYFLQNAALLLWSSNPKVFKPIVPTGSRISLSKMSCRIFRPTRLDTFTMIIWIRMVISDEQTYTASIRTANQVTRSKLTRPFPAAASLIAEPASVGPHRLSTLLIRHSTATSRISTLNVPR